MRPITIIGGGLAGLTLGMGLRRHGVPVRIHEAGHYPRHRVCGEFISGRGQEVLIRLGLMDAFHEAGATFARTAAFFFGPTVSPVRSLAQRALCLSRFKMDELLAQRFEAAGGELLQNQRWTGEFAREGIVRACGRRCQPSENGWHWFGLKAHARNVPLIADLEMHGSKAGYVGICRLEHETVNVCGLFRRPATGADAGQPTRDWLRGAPGTGLHQRLGHAVWEEGSFCSVAALPLRPRRASDLAECCIGDALTMVPPVTGNGMSMAFEAADLAIEPLAAYSRGQGTWPAAQRIVAERCDRAFAGRLAWAAWLQWLMFTPWLHSRFARLLLGSDWLWGLMFANTR